jgi:hypothetical protein
VIAPGDRVLFTAGEMQGVKGQTNTLKIIEVPGESSA